MPSELNSRRIAVAVAAALISWQGVAGMVALAGDGLAPANGFRFTGERRFAEHALGGELPVYEAMIELVPVDATILFVLDFFKLDKEERARQFGLAMSFRNLAWPRRCIAPTDLSKPEVAKRLAETSVFLLVLDPGAPPPPGHELLAGSPRMALYRQQQGGK